MRITIVRTQRSRFVYDVVNNTADVNLIFCSAQPRKTHEPTLNARVLLSLFMRFSRFSSFRFVRFLSSLFFIAFAQSPSTIIKPSALHLSIHSHVLGTDDWNNCFVNRYIMDGGKLHSEKMENVSGIGANSTEEDRFGRTGVGKRLWQNGLAFGGNIVG